MISFTTSQQKEVIDCINNIKIMADNSKMFPVITVTKDTLDMNIVQISYAYFYNNFDAIRYGLDKFKNLSDLADRFRCSYKAEYPVQVYICDQFKTNHVDFGWKDGE